MQPSLYEVTYLHWLLPDDPLTPLPVEIFLRDYYEPRLLSRIIEGETFKPIRVISELNRVHPEVRITSINREAGRPDQVTVAVTVTVSGIKLPRNQDKVECFQFRSDKERHAPAGVQYR